MLFVLVCAAVSLDTLPPCANYSAMERLSCFVLAYEVRNYKPNEAKLRTYGREIA